MISTLSLQGMLNWMMKVWFLNSNTKILLSINFSKSLSCGKLETNQSQGECIIENNAIDRQFNIIAIQTTLSQWKPL